MKYEPNTSSPSNTMDDSCLAERVLLFSRFLKNRGFRIFSSNIMDSLQSLEEIHISRKEDFFSALRSNLVTSDKEWELFDELFQEFWQDMDNSGEEEECEAVRDQLECEGDSVVELFQEVTDDHEKGGEDTYESGDKEAATYSPLTRLERKNIAKFDKGDIQIAQLILKNMIAPFKLSVTRRFKKSKKPGDMDFRRIMRESLKTGGMPLELFYKKKKKRLKRLVILADVSGSMDRYARFVMPFILGLKGIGSRAQVFVFSTSLTPITSIVRRLSIEKALEHISQLVPDWSGGTRIGYSLHQFNEGHGESLLNKRTVVVVMSDGWDLGGRELLKREMKTLSRKAHSVIWLNPLAGDTEYRPVCRGMQTALPYVDYFLAADSLQNLKKVGRTLSRVMAH